MFEDRVDAGRRLAARLRDHRGSDVVVVGLPRGGVPVAAQVARALEAPLDVIVIRKLGVPYEPELAMGAIGEGGVRVVDAEFVRRARVDAEELETIERRERAVLAARAAHLRGGHEPVPLAGRVALLVDDGIATGASVRAACAVARSRGAVRVVVATPVAPARMSAAVLGADELVCVEQPSYFRAVGQFYRDFRPTSDGEVAALLAGARPDATRVHEVQVPAGPVRLSASIWTSAVGRGVVVFAHGSGSSRHSPRNRYVADVLVRAGFAAVLLDLLTPGEEGDPAAVFDVPTLARRLSAVAAWVRAQPDLPGPLAYFGASTGAAAALVSAADLGAEVAAVVSRGGRPDLAGDALDRVTAPTLLLVGGADTQVLELNRAATRRMPGECELMVVPGATHLFEEPGALGQVAHAARQWLVEHLAAGVRDGKQGRG